ncbi:M3 family oligoendopeptidase [Anaerosporobacter faecicola]|uniref:M3 family oligoendopeptidase n=1 Tax=Anaerosporobacter faecicola TaxID=2718714 RepID=UPI0014386DD6|nr:M3 family oligoendopeptidase [Anaerosporobacter faecicola]
MNTEWSLDVLYKGYDDPAYQQDLKNFDTLAVEFHDLAESLGNASNKETVKQYIAIMERFNLLLIKLYNYTSLRESTNTTDSETSSYLNQLQVKMSATSKDSAKLDKYIATLPDLDEIVASDDSLKEYTFLFHRLKERATHMLSDDVEEVIAKLNLSAGSAWSSMQQYLTSTVEVDYKGEKTTLSAIRNLAYSKDKAVRKEAYEAEIACYDKIKDAVSFSLNNIKSQVNTISELRGYESPLALTLDQACMKKETLSAMLTAMKEYMPKFHEYLKRKATVLGYANGLPWYELFAPLGESHEEYTPESAKAYLIKHFRNFADDLADMVEEAFDNSWIDFFPRKGKVGGAFCAGLPYVKQSRVLTNFDGSFSDVVTLAHELGHAYHNLQIQDHHVLNYMDYSMPVAETASTFNENVIMNAAINEATGTDKLILIESQLQDTTQIICDIYSRFLFESAVFEKRKSEFLFSADLEKIMIDAQKQAFGDSLEEATLHPYMWVNKSHYYSEEVSFYNFPYAFGGLFARGLYAMYQKEGSAFVPKYRALLKATTVSSVEDVAKMAGIDLTKPDFWRQSLQSYSDEIDQFLELTK